MQVKHRLLPALLVGAGVAVFLSLRGAWPSDQHLRIVLGDRAPRVEEVRVRCGPGDGEWTREVMFHYAAGAAPRIVSYEPRLASGDYLVEIDVEGDDRHVRTTEHHIQLAGGTTSIDLSQR
jgi:hypothetical protein